MKLRLSLAVLAASALALKTESIYKSKESLYRPYVDRITGRVPFGNLSGHAHVVSTGMEAGIHLTSGYSGSAGSITGKHPLGMKNWRFDVHLSVKPGLKGVGLWIMRNFSGGPLFGGNEQYNGILVFLQLEGDLLGKVPGPSIGVATAYGGSSVVHFQKRISAKNDCIVRVDFVDGKLSVGYSERGKKVQTMGEMDRVSIDEGSFLSISGELAGPEGDGNVKSISVYRIRTRVENFKEEVPYTRPVMSWVVFAVLVSGVVYYMHAQKKKKPQKGILSK
ncbi:uncharacterized protein NEMAJ01_0719 [Nematocida major]|uniref:uncharacterized protein n=1 Tax=Nematocida major TaxID=1912982 RepID=UPI0020074469|nr:uncharacterized protein NEMAJ01_0719 [Nematocida major]KAH9385823.1 hypothetical protein NEMAJ01_0719 [Nematocida major]